MKLISIKGSPKTADLLAYLAKHDMDVTVHVETEAAPGVKVFDVETNATPDQLAAIVAQHTKGYKNDTLISNTPRVGMQITFAFQLDEDTFIYVMTDEKGHGKKSKVSSAGNSAKSAAKPKIKVVKKPARGC